MNVIGGWNVATAAATVGADQVARTDGFAALQRNLPAAVDAARRAYHALATLAQTLDLEPAIGLGLIFALLALLVVTEWSPLMEADADVVATGTDFARRHDLVGVLVLQLLQRERAPLGDVQPAGEVKDHRQHRIGHRLGVDPRPVRQHPEGVPDGRRRKAHRSDLHHHGDQWRRIGEQWHGHGGRYAAHRRRIRFRQRHRVDRECVDSYLTYTTKVGRKAHVHADFSPDGRRVAYTAGLFEALGLSPQEATDKARSYFTGYPPSSPSIALLREVYAAL